MCSGEVATAAAFLGAALRLRRCVANCHATILGTGRRVSRDRWCKELGLACGKTDAARELLRQGEPRVGYGSVFRYPTIRPEPNPSLPATPFLDDFRFANNTSDCEPLPAGKSLGTRNLTQSGDRGTDAGPYRST